AVPPCQPGRTRCRPRNRSVSGPLRSGGTPDRRHPAPGCESRPWTEDRWARNSTRGPRCRACRSHEIRSAWLADLLTPEVSFTVVLSCGCLDSFVPDFGGDRRSAGIALKGGTDSLEQPVGGKWFGKQMEGRVQHRPPNRVRHLLAAHKEQIN